LNNPQFLPNQIFLGEVDFSMAATISLAISSAEGALSVSARNSRETVSMIAGYLVNKVERRGESGAYSRSKSFVWAVIAVFTSPTCKHPLESVD